MKSSAAAILPAANTSAVKRERESIREKGRKKEDWRGAREGEERKRN